eukprot:7163670-Pyramimonas_sp.AAC.1
MGSSAAGGRDAGTHQFNAAGPTVRFLRPLLNTPLRSHIGGRNQLLCLCWFGASIGYLVGCSKLWEYCKARGSLGIPPSARRQGVRRSLAGACDVGALNWVADGAVGSLPCAWASNSTSQQFKVSCVSDPRHWVS